MSSDRATARSIAQQVVSVSKKSLSIRIDYRTLTLGIVSGAVLAFYESVIGLITAIRMSGVELIGHLGKQYREPIEFTLMPFDRGMRVAWETAQAALPDGPAGFVLAILITGLFAAVASWGVTQIVE